MDTQLDERELRAIVIRHCSDCDGLIAVLEEIQASCGYLPEAALRILAEITAKLRM